jgi:photosystem II stability/assembly factor-like uncharacterized protein
LEAQPALAATAATAAFPALTRPAVQVRLPERGVLLAVASAGTRTVAVGERGVVALSDDHGLHWRQAKAVPVAVTLTAVQFVDARQGWAVGHGGVVLKTEDGGENWRVVTDGQSLAAAALKEANDRVVAAPADAGAKAALTVAEALVAEGPDKPLFDLHFVDARRGWVIGAYNLIFETADGGATWRSLMARLDNPGARHLYSLAVQGDAVFIAGEQGALFRSLDGGASFQPLTTSYKGSWFKLIPLPGQGLVVAGLRGNAMYSPDRGNSWTRIDGAPPVTFVGGIAMADGSALLCNQAGQLLQSRAGGALVPMEAPALTLPAGLLASSGDTLLVVGMTGITRVPLPRAANTGAAAGASANKPASSR